MAAFSLWALCCLFQNGNTGQLLAGEPAGSLRPENPSDRAPARNVAEDHVGTSLVRSGIVDGYGDGGDGVDGGRRRNRSFGDDERNREKDASIVDAVVGPGTPRRGQDLDASGSSQPDAAGAAGAAAKKSARMIAGRLEEPGSTTGGLGGSGQQGGVSFRKSTSRGTAAGRQIPPSEGKAPFTSLVGAELAPSTNNSVAPAWCCGDNSSLEDLVCWTRGLDYDAAVNGL